MDLYPENAVSGTKILFLNFGAQESAFCISAIAKLRAKGVSAEIYPDSVKMKKQMSYANALNIPYVAIVGSDELASGKVTLKDMVTGTQEQLDVDTLIERIS